MKIGSSMRAMRLALALFLGFSVSYQPPARAAQEAYTDSSIHYDQVFRWRAMEAFNSGDVASAIRNFERAARYADKPSQFALGVIHMNGDGVPRDRALAFARLDVAAERGYDEIVEQRDILWDQLTDGERAAGQFLAKRLLGKYGDAKAKPRHRNKTLAALQHSLGKSKSVRDDVIVTDLANCSEGLVDFRRGNACHERDFYSSRFEAKHYWAVQDATWGKGGVVEVGPVLRPRSE